jgi:hypothetical protein
MKSLLLVWLCVIASASCEELDVRWRTAEDATHRYVLAVGTKGSHLSFFCVDGAALSRGEVAASSVHCESLTTYRLGHAPTTTRYWIVRPDGTKQDLPTSSQLFQRKDGIWSERVSDITNSELEDYLQSDPPDFSISSLVEFVDRLRGKNQKSPHN